MTPSRLLSSAVAAILTASRPAGLPDSVQIVAAGDKSPLVRPYLLAATDGGEGPHPRLLKLTLRLSLHTRADEQEATDAGTWHRAAVDYLTENPAALYATIQPHGYTILRVHPGEFSENEEESRARAYQQSWTVWMKAV